MTEFIKRVDELKDENITELFSGDVSILLIENANDGIIHKFGELEAQDLYGKKTVPIGTNTPEDPHVWSTPDMMWHQDRAYSDDVHPFVGLYCEAFEEGSAPTYFCDMKKAYQNLDDNLKEKIEDYECLFSVKTYFDQATYPHTFVSPKWERAFKMKAKATHKLVRQDKFGKYLFYSPGYTIPPFAKELNDQVFIDDNLFVHYWTPGQLMVWNNFTVSHKRGETSEHIDRRLLRYAFHEIIQSQI